MATTDDRLYKIQLPNLSDSNFGTSLKQTFKNIDSNFQKLANLGLTSGAPGKPAVWLPFNLFAAFCKVSNEAFACEYRLDSEFINDMLVGVESSYQKYHDITDATREQYIIDCIKYLDALIDCVPYDVSGSGEDIVYPEVSYPDSVWSQRWWCDGRLTIANLTLYLAGHPSQPEQPSNDYWVPKQLNIVASFVSTQLADTTNKINQYRTFIPENLMVSGAITDALKFTPIGTMACIYIDPRFRNDFVLSGAEPNTGDLSACTDKSCAMYGKLPAEESTNILDFEYVQAFPTIHCVDGEFYLSVNGIDTNIPLTGKPGADGSSAGMHVVVRDETPIDTSYYKIIDAEHLPIPTNPEALAQYDGDPAFIFPNVNGNNANQEAFYKTIFWIGHLEYDASQGILKAYCGPENKVEVDLYDHSFANSMMGLDPFEKSKAKPPGNVVWFKPRGLMLPIGYRQLDADGYAQISYAGPGEKDPTHFAAHLIYSDGENKSSKIKLHISSVDDYRLLGEPSTPGSHFAPGENGTKRVEHTELFVDEPVNITNYGDTSSLHSLDDTLLTVYGGGLISGSNTEDSISFSELGAISFNGYGAVSQPTTGYIGTDPCGLRVANGIAANTIYASQVGASYIVGKNIKAANGVYANNFVKCGDGAPYTQHSPNLLLANGFATSDTPFELLVDGAPVDGGIRFNYGDDNQPYFSIDVPSGSKIETTLKGKSFSKTGSYYMKNANGTNDNIVYWETCNTGNWYNDEMQKACIAYGVSAPTNSTNAGLIGVVLVSQNIAITTVRVLLALNGETHESGGVRYYGLPIKGEGHKSNADHKQGRFAGWELTNINDLQNIILPATQLKQYWGSQLARVVVNGSNGWEGDKWWDERYQGGLTCTLTTDGKILLGAGSPQCLMAQNRQDKNHRIEYAEFQFVYPTPEQTPEVRYYVLVNSNIIQNGEVISGRSIEDYAIDHNSPTTSYSSIAENLTTVQGSGDLSGYTLWQYNNIVQNSSSDVWYIISVPSTDPPTTTNNKSRIVQTFSPYESSGPVEPDDPTTSTVQPYNWRDVNIVDYLTRLNLLRDITSMFISNESDMNRWDGPHGSVSISDDGETKRLTVECWDSTFDNYLFKSYIVNVNYSQSADSVTTEDKNITINTTTSNNG